MDPATGMPTGEARARMERDLREAQAAFDENPDSLEAGIWVGRRLAYLGRYQAALDWYTQRLQEHPESVRLLRHRGHRKLTVRDFAGAAADLARAAELMQGDPDTEEPDGAPNRYGIPRSTTQTNVWYHLGLARYLLGDDEGALEAWMNGLRLAPNGDMRVATAHWTYLALRRTGREQDAKILVGGLDPTEDVIENFAYRDAIKLYRGDLLPRQVLERHADGLGFASAGYAVGAWRLANSDREKARGIFEQILREAPASSFGRMAAEADMARLR